MDTKEYTLLIGVLTKDSSVWIEGVLKNVEAYASLFKTYRCLIVDGHSVDTTRQRCEVWCSKDADRRSFKVQPSVNKQRGESLVEARSLVLQHYASQFGQKVLLLLLDGDSVNARPVALEGFKTCFKRTDWAALFANQPTTYYDVWALRSEECPNDYQIPVHLRQETWQSIEPYVKKLQARKPPQLGWLEVRSAFGGAGLYRTSSINLETDKYMCWQTVTVELQTKEQRRLLLPVCEHVPFHQSMVQRGEKLYINCEWLISDHL